MTKPLMCLLTAGFLFMGTAICWAGPVAVPVDSIYEFPPMAEGQGLTHEFIIKNEGDAQLNILGVIPP